MFKGLKHTIGCECGETTIACESMDEVESIENSPRKSECCGSKFKYIGLQPYYQSILAIPVQKIETIPFVQVEENIEEGITEEATTVKTQEETIQQESVPNNISEEPINVTNNANGINKSELDELVPPGPKGVTNAQMIPALKKLIDEGKLDKIEVVKNAYLDIFNNSVKYLPKKYQDKIK